MNFYKNKIIKSLIVFCILILLTTAVPATTNLSIKEINKNNYNSSYINETKSIENILMNIKYENLNLFTNNIIFKLLNFDKLDVENNFYKEVYNYFEMGDLTKIQLINLLKYKVIPLEKECHSIMLGDKSINEMSLELNNLWTIYNSTINKNDLTPFQNTNQDPDFDDYASYYELATNIWLGHPSDEQKWPILTFMDFLGISYDNYYEWSHKVTNHINFTIIASTIITSFCLVVLGGVPIDDSSLLLINILAGLIAAMLLYLNFQTLAYVSNGHEYMQRLVEREVNILIHIVDEDTLEGIDSLWDHYGITAYNQDAYTWCNGEDAKTPDFFTYFLGPSLYMDQINETGWYCLNTHYIGDGYSYDDIEKNYYKAPCPPGTWRIKIYGNEEYREYPEFEIKIGKGQTAIIQDIFLERRQE